MCVYMYIINSWTHLCWDWMSFRSLKLQQSLAPTELWNFPSFHLFTSDLPLLPSNRADQLPIIINFKYKHLTLRTNNKQSNKKTSPIKEPRIYLQSPQMSGPVSLESEIISSLLTVSVQDWDSCTDTGAGVRLTKATMTWTSVIVSGDEMGKMQPTTVVHVSPIFKRKQKRREASAGDHSDLQEIFH